MKLHPGLCRIREAQSASFTISVAGDFCPTCSKRTQKAIADGQSGRILGDLKETIRKSDLRLLQFETPLTDHGEPIPKSGPNLISPPSCAAFAQAFDVALLANNHTGDQGPAACMETIRLLTEAGVKTVGAGANMEEAVKPLNLDVKGEAVQIINVAEREFGHARRDAAGVAPLDPFENILQIRQAKAAGKFVAVVCHGGHEFYPFPSVRMRKTFRAFADAGADIVINIHTHCPLGTEVWNGTPIVYSTGNFFFPEEDTEDRSWALPSWYLGYLPVFHCDKNGVHAFELIPYSFDFDQIHTLKGADLEAFFDWLNLLSGKLDDLNALDEYFKIWTARIGEPHLNILAQRVVLHPAVLTDRSLLSKFIVVRNLYTCEAHVDLVREYLVLIEENTLARYQARWDELEAIRHPAFAEKYLI